MDVNEIKNFLPLKAKAEVAMQNENYGEAAEFIIEFADELTSYYKNGDASYDSVRVAYLGTSNAALILGKLDHKHAAYYSKEACLYARMLYKEKMTPNNALALVSSTQVLLHNVDLSAHSNDSSFYDESVMLADRLCGYLKQYFPDEASIDEVVKAYNYAKSLYRDRTGHVKLYEGLGNASVDKTAASIAMSDSTEFRYLYQKYWTPEVNFEADKYVEALHSLIMEDVSLSYARECEISEMCTNNNPDEWDGLSDDLFYSYDQICSAYGIKKIDYMMMPKECAIPFISNRNAAIFRENAIKCFLSLYNGDVPFVRDCSLLFDDSEICDNVERAFNEGREDIGLFLLKFITCMIETESVFIDNSITAIKAKKLYTERECLSYYFFKLSQEELQSYQKECKEIAEEISGRLNHYIDNVISKGFPNQLKRYEYNDMGIYALLKSNGLKG